MYTPSSRNLLTLLAATTLCPVAGQNKSKPNVLIILADDMGYGDYSLHGGKTPTPAIDRLAEEGIELTQFMCCPLSSPTRCMLLTGRHPLRMNNAPKTDGTIPLDEMTIGKAFRQNGYATGMFGKWHNSEDPNTPEFMEAYLSIRPDVKPGVAVNDYGFDETWNYYGGGPDHLTRRTMKGKGFASWWHNRTYTPQEEGYTENLIADHAIEFIRAHKNRPFLCYVATELMHAPLQTTYEDYLKIPESVRADQPLLSRAEFDKKVKNAAWEEKEIPLIYSAMTIGHNRNVKRILDELDELNLRENTIVVYFSDNGATLNGNNSPFRGGKHTLWEGGTHLPAFIRWRQIEPGTRWNGLCGAMDLFPTLVEMTGIRMPEGGYPLDGKSFWSALRSQGPSPIESYYWTMVTDDALRTDRYKLKRYWDHVELYDLKKDIGETTDISKENPQIVEQLTGRMDKWIEDMNLAVTHVPVKKDVGTPAPQGEVLEISITQTRSIASVRNWLMVNFAEYSRPKTPQDILVADIMVPAGYEKTGYRLIQYKGKGVPKTVFTPSTGVDQYGRLAWRGEMPRAGYGQWERRAYGMSNDCPYENPFIGFYFGGNRTGNFKVYVDNVHMLHKDGSKTVIWESGKDNTFQKSKYQKLPEGFENLSVKTVPLNQIQ